jgi:Ca-activated chloride channel homolog
VPLILLASALAALWTLKTDVSARGQFRSTVNTVAVYATVSDPDGRLVPDLPRDRFQVFDNGRPVEIALFSNERQPITVAIMLDMSGSMVSRYLKVRESTLWFVNALLPDDRAQIGSFGEEVAISPLLTGDKAVLTRVLKEELWPLGPTPLWNAAEAAMTALGGQTGRRVVLMLTDGADSCNFPRCRKFGDVEKRAKREDFMFYAIAMDERGIGADLVKLVQQTGGGHFALDAGDNLTDTFSRVADELRHQYLIGFSPTVLDGREHQLEVRLSRPGLQARARTSYHAGKSQ